MNSEIIPLTFKPEINHAELIKIKTRSSQTYPIVSGKIWQRIMDFWNLPIFQGKIVAMFI